MTLRRIPFLTLRGKRRVREPEGLSTPLRLPLALSAYIISLDFFFAFLSHLQTKSLRVSHLCPLSTSEFNNSSPLTSVSPW